MLPDFNSISKKFINFIERNPQKHIAIRWSFATHDDIFLQKIQENDFFVTKNILQIFPYNKKSIKKILSNNQNKSFDYIFIIAETFSFLEYQDLLEEYNISGYCIFQSHKSVKVRDVKNFTIPSISFREFCDSHNQEVIIADVLNKTANIDSIHELAEKYIYSWSFINNLQNNSGIFEEFYKKCTVINEELFEKERNEFLNFIRNIALNIGNIYKEEAVAKSMNISRRKARKFLDLLLKYDIISALEPLSENTKTETMRHVKFYFTDLSFYRGAMGENYNIGNTKKWVIENFIFVELSRKLDETHELFFWRKKSGTELSFILKNKETNWLTPIEVDIFESKHISLAMKSFYDTYTERIEHGMVLNEHYVELKNFYEKTFFMLPYYTI